MINAYGEYKGGLRRLAKLVKIGKPSSIRHAARIFAAMLPIGACVVPMPSHNGRATVMLDVARQIETLRGDVRTADVLRCIPHEGMYTAKRAGRTPPTPEMFAAYAMPDGARVCVIDNVVDTGTTYNAAAKALHGAVLYAIAHT